MIHNPQHQQMVLDTLITTLQDPNPEIRAKSAQALGTIGPTTIIPHLLTALQDPEPIVRQNAAIGFAKLQRIALGKLGNDTILPDLITKSCKSRRFPRQNPPQLSPPNKGNLSKPSDQGELFYLFI